MSQEIKHTLINLGFSEKEITTYLTLLSQGPSSVRKLAEAANLNRGSAYEALKSLQKEGLVSYYHKEKNQYFSAEDPKTLLEVVKKRQESLQSLEKDTKDIIPELKSRWSELDDRPVVKYYEDHNGIKTILQDVLDTVEETKEKEYFVYSSKDLRPHLYKKFPSFTEERIKRNIKVSTIAIGAGGKDADLAERKWLTKKGALPTYTLIYAGKLAMISLDKDDGPRGVIVEDQNLFETQKILFSHLWETLK